MQDMENPQVTSCNKGDQHYRSSPSNQSSSSDPGPCGSSTWSQQPGYDGYGTTAALLFSFWNSLHPYVVPPGTWGLAVMNAATISPSIIPENLQFCKMTAIFPHEMTKSSVHFWPVITLFFSFFLSFIFCVGSDLTKQWNYAWHSLIPHPEHKRGKMMSFMYEIFFPFNVRDYSFHSVIPSLGFRISFRWT